MLEGGSTKPWRVFALQVPVNGKPEVAYVVKLFSPTNATQQPCIAKEFIGNFLAKEFELFVPSAGLIDLNTVQFRSTLGKSEISILVQKHYGPTYASKLLDGPLMFGDLDDNSIGNINEKALVYAFDALIFNTDRWGYRKKPNLIIHDDKFMLIDHELIMPFIDEGSGLSDNIIYKIDNGSLFYEYKLHLFYNSLKEYNGNKNTIFDTFHEYLVSLNLNRLKSFVSELQENEIEVGSIEKLFEYLTAIKNRATKFCELLLISINE